ncbi:MAG: hypothetical protein AAF432_13765 [Planctomycetota bacterium]
MKAFWVVIALLLISAGAMLTQRGDDASTDAIRVATTETPARFALPTPTPPDTTRTPAPNASITTDDYSSMDDDAAFKDEPPPITAFSAFVNPKHTAEHETEQYSLNGALTFDVPPPNAVIHGGDGSQADPYIIDFDVLGTAYHTYRPADDVYEMPDLVTGIDGSWVILTGYHIFPAAMPEIPELLITKTEWDGCCIGLPPSPYDGVEVRLAAAVSPLLLRSGPIATVSGRLKIDPYLHDQWLLSLYIIEDAQIVPEL